MSDILLASKNMRPFWITAGAVLMSCCLAAAQTDKVKDADDWKGDLTGVWQGPYTPDLTRGSTAVMTAWGQDKFNHFDGKMDPCLPVGVTRQANAPDPIQIVQTPKRVVILYESWHIFRSIPTDRPAGTET